MIESWTSDANSDSKGTWPRDLEPVVERATGRRGLLWKGNLPPGADQQKLEALEIQHQLGAQPEGRWVPVLDFGPFEAAAPRTGIVQKHVFVVFEREDDCLTWQIDFLNKPEPGDLGRFALGVVEALDELRGRHGGRPHGGLAPEQVFFREAGGAIDLGRPLISGLFPTYQLAWRRPFDTDPYRLGLLLYQFVRSEALDSRFLESQIGNLPNPAPFWLSGKARTDARWRTFIGDLLAGKYEEKNLEPLRSEIRKLTALGGPWWVRMLIALKQLRSAIRKRFHLERSRSAVRKPIARGISWWVRMLIALKQLRLAILKRFDVEQLRSAVRKLITRGILWWVRMLIALKQLRSAIRKRIDLGHLWSATLSSLPDAPQWRTAAGILVASLVIGALVLFSRWNSVTTGGGNGNTNHPTNSSPRLDPLISAETVAGLKNIHWSNRSPTFMGAITDLPAAGVTNSIQFGTLSNLIVSWWFQPWLETNGFNQFFAPPSNLLAAVGRLSLPPLMPVFDINIPSELEREIARRDSNIVLVAQVRAKWNEVAENVYEMPVFEAWKPHKPRIRRMATDHFVELLEPKLNGVKSNGLIEVIQNERTIFSRVLEDTFTMPADLQKDLTNSWCKELADKTLWPQLDEKITSNGVAGLRLWGQHAKEYINQRRPFDLTMELNGLGLIALPEKLGTLRGKVKNIAQLGRQSLSKKSPDWTGKLEGASNTWVQSSNNATLGGYTKSSLLIDARDIIANVDALDKELNEMILSEAEVLKMEAIQRNPPEVSDTIEIITRLNKILPNEKFTGTITYLTEMAEDWVLMSKAFANCEYDQVAEFGKNRADQKSFIALMDKSKKEREIHKRILGYVTDGHIKEAREELRKLEPETLEKICFAKLSRQVSTNTPPPPFTRYLKASDAGNAASAQTPVEALKSFETWMSIVYAQTWTPDDRKRSVAEFIQYFEKGLAISASEPEWRDALIKMNAKLKGMPSREKAR